MALRSSALRSLRALSVGAGSLPAELSRGASSLDVESRTCLLAYRLFSEVSRRDDKGQVLTEYVGPFSVAVGKVKKLSLFSCACALAAGPVIFGLDATSTFTAKASIAGTLSVFGVFTTGLLQWFTGPYVQQLKYQRDTDTVEVTTLNLFAKPQTQRFHIAEVQTADTVHPLSSFMARNKIYYIDADHFPDKELLSRLAPQQAAAHVVEGAEESRKQEEQQSSR